MAKKKWEKPPTYKKFSGKTYKLKDSTNNKRGADSFAKSYRERGDAARVVKAKGKDNKTYYLIYTR